MFCFDGINKFCWWLLAENIEWIFIVGFKFPIWQNYNKSFFSFTIFFLEKWQLYIKFPQFFSNKILSGVSKFSCPSSQRKTQETTFIFVISWSQKHKNNLKKLLTENNFAFCFIDIFCNKKLKEVIKVSTIFLSVKLE